MRMAFVLLDETPQGRSVDFEVMGMAQEPPETAEKTNKGRPVDPAGASKMASDASLRNLLPLAWPLFVVMWLVFPVASVFDMLGTNPTPVRLLAFLVLMLAYVAVYLWLMLRYPFRSGESSPRERRLQVALLATLTALALCLEVAYGTGIPYHFMFVVIAAAVTLPTRHAAWTVVTIMALTSGIYALRSGWDALLSSWESAVAPFAIVGFSMIIVSRLVVTVRELRAAREEIARLAVAEERLRFARDLHDLLGHSLSLITLKSELAGRLLPAAPEKAATEVHDIEGVARQALREVREAVAGYRQPMLDEELEGAREMLEAAGIACRVEREPGKLPPRTEAVLAWTVREGVTNVIRHSRAKRCEIRLRREGDEIQADISDDGQGSSGETGSGLSGLAERVVASGGDFEAGPLPGGGFRLRVSLPLRSGTVPASEPAPGRGILHEDERR
jgi:two-component system, NarL family, sensor histidine kinase DesK